MSYIKKGFLCLLVLNLIISQLFVINVHANTQLLTIRLSVPMHTPENANIYITGSFNNWNPKDESFKLKKITDFTYEIGININIGTRIEYKFTRGSWDNGEVSLSGQPIQNRNYTAWTSSDTIQNTVQNWLDFNGHTESGIIKTINNFYMPQLNRYRTIRICLPLDYYTSSKSYPVLYMQDGQNIFNNATSSSGEWNVDETVQKLFRNGKSNGVIIVGIDNGGVNRINEYSPWTNSEYGGGQGDKYAEFIVNTLKPYIDQNYRTLEDRQNTAIAGSSMGGLISYYTGLKYQNIFSKVGAFSSSFWFARTELHNFIRDTGKSYSMKVYLDAGKLEGSNESVVVDTQNVYNTMLSSGFSSSDINFVIDPNGTHSEYYWSMRFPNAFTWLMSDVKATETINTYNVKLLSASCNQIASGRYLYSGYIDLKNIAYTKVVSIHYTTGNGVWQDLNAKYIRSSFGDYEKWYFEQELSSPSIQFAVKYTVNGQTYWDNNSGADYYLDNSTKNFVLGQSNVSLGSTTRSSSNFSGSIYLKNLAFSKTVKVVYTTDNWITTKEATATYNSKLANGIEKWSFSFPLQQGATIRYAVYYNVNSQTYWDNAFGINYIN